MRGGGQGAGSRVKREKIIDVEILLHYAVCDVDRIRWDQKTNPCITETAEGDMA